MYSDPDGVSLAAARNARVAIAAPMKFE